MRETEPPGIRQRRTGRDLCGVVGVAGGCAAAEEYVDYIGYRIMDREWRVVVFLLMERLKERGLEHVQVVVGGIIPRQDIPKLKAMGVGEVFRPGAKLTDIVAYVKGHARASARSA